MYKKKILIVLIIIALLSVMTVVSNASTDGVITGETVKLREGPSLDAGLVTLLSVDNKVEVLSKNGDWYQVKYKNYEGYVYADYIEVNGEVEDTTNNNNTQTNNVDNVNTTATDNNTVENTTVANEVTNTAIENSDTNNTVDTTSSGTDNTNLIGTSQILTVETALKILPLINSDNLETLAKDTVVTVNDQANGWAFVSNGAVSGWVREDNLTPSQENTDSSAGENSPESTDSNAEENPSEDTNTDTQPAEENQTETQETKTGYISAGSVNVRESASTSANVITTLTRNTEVTIESEENGWAKISTSSGVNGYVSNQYISEQQVQETNRGSSERTENIQTKVETKEAKTANTSSKGADVVDYAKTLIGKAYVYGGVGPNSFDCSGFTKFVYGRFGVNLLHSASAQANVGTTISKSNLNLGDMVFFSQGGSSIGHVGIYVGNNSFIHAANPQKGVVITSLSDGYYTRNYITAKRVL